MAKFQITAPAKGFSGEVAGVVFSRGHATADSEQDEAALGYFRRKGYTVAAVEEQLAPPAVAEEQQTPDEGDEPFDPSKHDAPEVLAYLDALGADDSDAVAEFDRVIEAEKAGKARKTILARAGSEGDDQK